MEKKKLTHAELEERIAVLKRFKSLLKDQRDKFSEYLFVLEKQELSITQNNIEAMLQHTEVENGIIENILNIQKVIEPIEKMYTITNAKENDKGILQLKNDLGRLQESVLRQNKKNRMIIEEKMEFIKEEIVSFPKAKYVKNVYAKDEDVAIYIDVSF